MHYFSSLLGLSFRALSRPENITLKPGTCGENVSYSLKSMSLKAIVVLFLVMPCLLQLTL
jgi:hypothetical protein